MTAKGPKTGVWSLSVVSSEAQAETLQHQRAWAKETAKRCGWHITRSIEGVSSGKDGPRRLLRDILADLKNLDPDARPARILVIRLDRVGRGSVAESAIVLHELLQLGVGVHTRDQGDVKLDSAMDELIAAAQLAVARHENDVRRDKMRTVYRRKREAGVIVGNRPPFGLRISEDGKTYCATSAKHKNAILEAFELRAAGYGLQSIGERLSQIAPPHRFINGKEYVVRWTQTRVARLLGNPAYAAIVDRVTMARAQRTAKNAAAVVDRTRDKRRRFPWPLSGSIRCACGRAMTGMACGTPENRVRYYACRTPWVHEVAVRLVRADNLEDQFVNLLRRLRASPALLAKYQNRTRQSPEPLKKRIHELERNLSDIDRGKQRVWDLHAKGQVRDTDVQERLDKLAETREGIQKRLAETREHLVIAQHASNERQGLARVLDEAARRWATLPEPNQRRIAQAIALVLGGFTVTAGGTLTIGNSVDPLAQRKPHAKRLVKP
jgi:DNA invertase Pin-like site-specific DNA recombinase